MPTVINILVVFAFVLLYMTIETKPSKSVIVHNDGTVNFCDVQTFNSNILDKIQKTPLSTISKSTTIESETISLEDVSTVSFFFINELNKVSNSCFHIMKLHSMKTYTVMKYKVTDFTIQVYSQQKNYNMLLNVIAYFDENKIFIHSIDMVTPVPLDDKWSKEQNYQFKPLQLEDKTVEAYENDTSINSYSLNDITSSKQAFITT